MASVDDDDDYDMLASGSYDKLEFEHNEVRDPEAEKVDKEIKAELNKIPSKFNAPTSKAPAKKPVVSPAKAPVSRPARPTTAKPSGTIPRP